MCAWCDTDWVQAHHKTVWPARLSWCGPPLKKASAGSPAFFSSQREGEPSLQFDHALTIALRGRSYRISMEANDWRAVDHTLVDWLTISPMQSEFVQKSGDELKVLFTGTAVMGLTPDVASVRRLGAGTSFANYFLQPVDRPGSGPNYQETVAAVMELGSPWHLSAPTHKVAGIRWREYADLQGIHV